MPFTKYSNTHGLLAYAVRGLPAGQSHRFAATQELRNFFHAMHLPLPQAEEYFDGGPKGSALIFIEDYGVTLRIHPRQVYDENLRNHPQHPLLQQPLTQVEGQHFVYELYAGLQVGRTGANYMHMNQRKTLLEDSANAKTVDIRELLRRKMWHDDEENIFYDILSQDGIHHNEPCEWNRGFIPVSTRFFPRGIPLGLDQKYVASAENMMCMDIIHPASLEAQEAIHAFYAPVKQTLHELWPEGTWPDRRQIPKLWSKLASFKAEGILIDGWNDKARMLIAHAIVDADADLELQYIPHFPTGSHLYAERVRAYQQQAIAC